ncbi:DUF4041 domain-containing protein [Bauldia litoralis]|uniref:T5orf172 domain-containing protein n=1 Tax=Bauldia litoralis TaxID=665467 RepID=A0A1G6B6K0_9HYPH|nr:DUF4041 domain-containing protein [Bauldia litoralis]SDB16288.1 T5orf172 domain-containing protein [Bauldia litoralis]
MTTEYLTVGIFIALVCLLPVLWGISTHLWLKARRRARTAEEAAARSSERVDEAFRDADRRATEAEGSLRSIRQRFSPVIKLDEELRSIEANISSATSELRSLRASYSEKKAIYDRLATEVAIFDERLAFAELGVYEPHFDFSDSEQYKVAIRSVREVQKRMTADKKAVFCSTEWSVEGSKAKGQTMTNRSIRLTLRAFNNECEAAIANTRWNNVNSMEKRIIRAYEQIEKMNASLQVNISYEYLECKLKELRLTHEQREKIKAEKEERAEAARQAREEQRLQRDLEKAEEDENHYATLLQKAKVEVASIVGDRLDAFENQIHILERDLAEAHARAERAKALAERTRIGWVYIISNIGSFGDGVVKIGLTRRLDPLDRIRELGDASVPFRFDVHAIIYSEDAAALESALHSVFESVRINTQNLRKEFFQANLSEVEQAVRVLAPDASFFKDVEAQEYRETLARRTQLFEHAVAAQEEYPAEI